MAHKVKKDEKKRENRGETFVGCRPMIEEGKRGRVRKSERKHKKKFLEDFS